VRRFFLSLDKASSARDCRVLVMLLRLQFLKLSALRGSLAMAEIIGAHALMLLHLVNLIESIGFVGWICKISSTVTFALVKTID
jgi:hypothetical protein